MWKVVLFLAQLSMLFCGRISNAQQAIFLVRHAEQSVETDDPELTEAGRKRADRLAAILRDAGITLIYTTERRRAIQTAEPIEKLLNIKSKRMLLRDVAGLVAQIRAQRAEDRILVISHSLAIPRLLKMLGHPAEVTIPLSEYDNLFIVIPRSEGTPTVLRLRY